MLGFLYQFFNNNGSKIVLYLTEFRVVCHYIVFVLDI